MTRRPGLVLARPRAGRVAGAVLAMLALTCGFVSPTAHAATASAGVAGRAPWWNGDCDAAAWNSRAEAAGWHGAGAHPLGASYLGIEVCGPRPSVDGAPNVRWQRPGWGELEYQCV